MERVRSLLFIFPASIELFCWQWGHPYRRKSLFFRVILRRVVARKLNAFDTFGLTGKVYSSSHGAADDD